jgi:hypothetical protein
VGGNVDCTLLQSRQTSLVFFENGFDRGALGTASLWTWLASTLVEKNTTAAQRTTNQAFQRTVIKEGNLNPKHSQYRRVLP